MSQSIKCPNCKAPVEPDPARPTIACTYCGHHMKNTLYVPPKPKPSPPPAGQPPAMRRHMWLVYTVPVVLIVLGFATSWLLRSRSRPTTTTRSGSTSAALPAHHQREQTKLDPSRQLELKLGLYIECLSNTYRFMLENGRDRYLGWIKDPKAGPTCKERWASHGVIAAATSWVEGCGKQAEEAAALPPDLPVLERAGTAYAAAVQKLGPLLVQAAAYYEKKSYALDDCKKGQELHPKLMAGFKGLVEARERLKPLLAARVKGSLQRCIDRSQGDAGRKVIHHWARAVKLAGDALIEMRAQWKVKQPDLDRVKKAVARFDEALTAMEALGDAEKGEAGWSYHWHKRPMDEFQSAAIAFLKSKAGRRLGATNRHLIRVSGWKRSSIEGTFEKVAKHYDAIVAGTAQLKHCGRLPPCDFEECPEPR